MKIPLNPRGQASRKSGKVKELDSQKVFGSKDFIGLARMDLYRKNAFRVTELPVDVALSEIERQTSEVKIMERLGCNLHHSNGPLPLEPAPDTEAILEGLCRIQEPEQRMIDEFFWFWPLEHSRTDRGLDALAKGDAGRACEIWRERSFSDGDIISVHNLAVLFHTMALDLEHFFYSGVLVEEQRQIRDNHWQEAFKLWKSFLDKERFWSHMDQRGRELGGFRWAEEDIERFKKSLPLMILLINSQIASMAAERGDISEAMRHKTLMQDSGFEEDMVSRALALAVQPIREKIKMFCSDADMAWAGRTVDKKLITQRLIEQTGPRLAIVDCLLPGYPLRDEIYKEVNSRTARPEETVAPEKVPKHADAAFESARSPVEDHSDPDQTGINEGEPSTNKKPFSGLRRILEKFRLRS